MAEKIKGELQSFSVRTADFWGTGIVHTKHDGGRVAIVGKLVGAQPGDTVELEGDFATHPKYGPQFKVRSCVVVLPSDVSGVVGWLASKLPQISRRRAEQLVEKLGVQGLWDVLDAGEAGKLCVVDGITPGRALEILEAYKLHKGERDRLVRLKTWGLTDNQIARVVKEWGDNAEERMSANPYELMECVDGFGWKRADQVALKMGMKMDSQPRLSAGLLHAMGEAKAAGHCFWSQGKLVAVVTTKICGITDESLVRRALDSLLERKKLVRLDTKIYLPELAVAEGRLAKVFATRARSAGKAA